MIITDGPFGGNGTAVPTASPNFCDFNNPNEPAWSPVSGSFCGGTSDIFAKPDTLDPAAELAAEVLLVNHPGVSSSDTLFLRRLAVGAPVNESDKTRLKRLLARVMEAA